MRVSLKEIMYIVVLAIGGILFWVFSSTYAVSMHEVEPVGFQRWIFPIIVGAGIALLVMVFGYEIYRMISE